MGAPWALSLPTSTPSKPVILESLLVKNAADLQDRLRRLLHAVPRVDHLLRLRALQMGAAVGHHAVAGFDQVQAHVVLPDDGVVADAW